MKTAEPIERKWVGVDLHVHTPASRDYRGSRDKSEFLAIIRKANEFGALAKKGKRRAPKSALPTPYNALPLLITTPWRGFGRSRIFRTKRRVFRGLFGKGTPRTRSLHNLKKTGTHSGRAAS
jgi:hypothetical protein